METNLSLKISRSPWILVYFLFLHLLMLWTTWQVDINEPASVVLSVLLCFSLWYQLGRYQWLPNSLAIIEVNYQAADHNTNARWALHYEGDREFSPCQFVSSVVVAEMVVIRFRAMFPAGKWRRHETVIILAGSVSPDDFRRLRIMLRAINVDETR